MAGFGLRNASNAFSGTNTGGLLEFKMADNYAVGTFAGDPIILNATSGMAERSVTAPTDLTGNVVGFAVGFRYVSTADTPTWNQQYPAAGGTDVYVFVTPASKSNLLEVQGDAEWNQNQVGRQNALVPGAGLVSTGNSGYTVANRTATSATGAVIIRGVKEDGVNENSTTPILYVQISNGVSAFETGV
tara:strand:+ start:966 stop:1529 length:564 start_codon:yes stop_codon:yes gene_type:complete